MAKFVPNYIGIKALGSTPQMQSMLKDKAEEVTEEAKRNAPVETGHYRDSIEAVSGTEEGKAVGRVNANAWYAGFVEFGTIKTTARHILANAAEHIGLRLKPDKS